MDRGIAKFAGRLRGQITVHESLAGASNSCCCPHFQCGTWTKGGTDCLERTCHRGERRPAARAPRLVIAENVSQPQSIPPELTRIEGSLKKFFGYNQFQVIGQSQKTLKTGQEDWLATSKFFALHVDARGESEAGYVLNLKLYKEKELLLETDAKLSKRSPLVIKGPQVGSGQLLLVLVVQ